MKKQLSRRAPQMGTRPAPVTEAPRQRPATKPTVSSRSARPKVDREAIQRAYDERSDTGRFKSYMKPEALSSVWVPGKGTHVISILPTWSPSENKFTFFNRVYYHSNVGVNDDNYICNARMFKKRCFICEKYAEYVKECEEKDMDPEDDKLRTMRPGQRVLYNVRVVTDDRSVAEGNKIFMAPAKKLHSEILELCKNPRTGELICVGDVDDGMDVQFTKEGEGISTDYKGIRLIDREPIPDEWVKNLCVLEESYHIPEYEELRNVYLGVPSEDETYAGEEENEVDGATEDDLTAAANEGEESEGEEVAEDYGEGEEEDVPVFAGEDGDNGEGEDDEPEPEPVRRPAPQRKPVRPSPTAAPARRPFTGRR